VDGSLTEGCSLHIGVIGQTLSGVERLVHQKMLGKPPIQGSGTVAVGVGMQKACRAAAWGGGDRLMAGHEKVAPGLQTLSLNGDGLESAHFVHDVEEVVEFGAVAVVVGDKAQSSPV
jgi:hypothetical protein